MASTLSENRRGRRGFHLTFGCLSHVACASVCHVHVPWLHTVCRVSTSDMALGVEDNDGEAVAWRHAPVAILRAGLRVVRHRERCVWLGRAVAVRCFSVSCMCRAWTAWMWCGASRLASRLSPSGARSCRVESVVSRVRGARSCSDRVGGVCTSHQSINVLQYALILAGHKQLKQRLAPGRGLLALHALSKERSNLSLIFPCSLSL